jgi:hypothetical protein
MIFAAVILLSFSIYFIIKSYTLFGYDINQDFDQFTIIGSLRILILIFVIPTTVGFFLLFKLSETIDKLSSIILKKKNKQLKEKLKPFL